MSLKNIIIMRKYAHILASLLLLSLILSGVLISSASATSVTYNASSNVITVTGYTEATPCTFTDIYNADKAGTLTLQVRIGITGTDGTGVTINRAERPTDYVVLGGASNDLYIIIGSWVGTTATIRITGTDRDGTAQTEDIVVTANGGYPTTKWFKTITQTQVTAFTGTHFSYSLVQGQWGVVWKQDTNQFTFNAAITIGDGSTTTWFADTNKEIINVVLVAGTFINVLDNTNFRIGELVDAAKHITKRGCAFYSLPTTTTILINSTVPVYLYSSYFSVNANVAMLICPSGSRLWNSVIAKNLYPKDAEIDIVNVISSGVVGGWANVTTENWILLGHTYAIMGDDSNSFSIKNTKIIGATYDFYISNLTVDCYAINTEAGWVFYWDGDSIGVVYRQYEFDLKVIDKDNVAIDNATVKIWDKDSNLIVVSQTDANGVIATTTISRGYYNQANGNTLQEYSPHLIKIEKAGYTTYEADFTLEEKTDWLIALQTSGGGTANGTYALIGTAAPIGTQKTTMATAFVLLSGMFMMMLAKIRKEDEQDVT